MGIKSTKHLLLTLDDKSVECQLSTAALTDTSSPEELTSFCGVEKVPAVPAYELAVSGWQDYGLGGTAPDISVCDLIHDAYTSEPIAEIDFELTVGGATRTGAVKPTQDLPFGGDAGILTFDTVLSVVGVPTDGTAA